MDEQETSWVDSLTPTDAYHGDNAPMGHYETGE